MFLNNTHIHEGITLFSVLWSLVRPKRNNWNILLMLAICSRPPCSSFEPSVINWAKLTRYMSAWVQEPEPRGNRSEACELLTQNRLLQNATFIHYLEWHHCTALSRVWTLICIFTDLFRNISKMECLVQMVWGHFKTDISIRAVSSSSPSKSTFRYYDFQEDVPHVSFKNSSCFSS